ncbi:MAG: S8 family serine peptidase, partial [Candidatus Eisenbacteria sp.]|nr:S8 family serine peptidase [Candidatus Eisenbacteria bacterium]
FNGFSIEIEPSELGKLVRIPGVKNIYPVEQIALPEPEQGISPDLYTALAMTGADAVQDELGYTGAGIKVGVIDTGIDYNHPDLGGGFGPGFRVAYGWDFVGDAFTGPEEPVPDDDPYDCYGHGTHVAGIIGAHGDVIGVAPEVTFGAYRVFGCEGHTWGDIMIAAMEMALEDGMDVVNMSIGAAFQWPQYPTAIASDRLVNMGVVVVASIGNNGAYGLYSAGAPGLGEKVIGVASFDNTHVYVPYFEVEEEPIGYITMSYSPEPPTDGTYRIVPANLDGTEIEPSSLVGNVALVARGTYSFRAKAINAINDGAIAVVIHNHSPGLFSGTLSGPLPDPRPVVGISLADGMFIRAQTEPVYMTWTDGMISAVNPTGGLISSFSSYGLAPDLTLKPDIGAPGGSIYSTYPLAKGGYATMSGTSMSSPHVAGAAALLLEAKPSTPAQAVRGILQNSADPADWWGYPGVGYIDNVHRQGAGMLDIYEAILSTTKIEPAKISAGESEAGPFVQELTIENNAAMDVTYDLSFVNALTTGPNTFSVGFYLGNAWVGFSDATVTVPAGSTVAVEATIYPATGPMGGIYGGYIVFTPQGGGQVYRVPYAGYVGDYQGIQVLAPGYYGVFPALGWTPDGENFWLVPPGTVYTMEGYDIPYFLVHLQHQSRVFRVEIFAENGRAWHQAYNLEYLPRNSTTGGFYAFGFDGTTFAGRRAFTVPDGTYYAVISVLKANGDDDNPDHWETWTSPVFVIDRP